MSHASFRRQAGLIPAVLILAACNNPSSEAVSPRDIAVPGSLGVPNSVQQVYAPGTASTPSTAIPRCGSGSTADCYDGPLLSLQAVKIGHTAAEPTIAVAPDGTAYFAASTLNVDTQFTWGVTRTNILKSTDGGLNWASVHPNIAGVNTPPANADPLIYLDPATGRVFVFDLAAACNWMAFSDDQGASWTSVPLACGNPPVDHQTLIAALPVGPLMTIGYPNMLIWCSNRVVDGTCGRSFDGGLTWSPGGQPFLGFTPQGDLCSALAGHLATDADGRLFLPTAHCGFPQVSVSSDGGLTWIEVTVSDMASPVTHTSVATDSAGNVYYVWIDEKQKPFLAYSTDHGMTWSAPMMIAPPGVQLANFPVVNAGAPGKVAINFPSALPSQTKPRKPPAWDQTVVISENVLAPDPVFLSATANDPALPIHRGACLGRCGGMWDFLDVEISPAGETWASASFDCSGACLTDGAVLADHNGQGVAIRQIGGPRLR